MEEKISISYSGNTSSSVQVHDKSQLLQNIG